MFSRIQYKTRVIYPSDLVVIPAVVGQSHAEQHRYALACTQHVQTIAVDAMRYRQQQSIVLPDVAGRRMNMRKSRQNPITLTAATAFFAAADHCRAVSAPETLVEASPSYQTHHHPETILLLLARQWNTYTASARSPSMLQRWHWCLSCNPNWHIFGVSNKNVF